MKTQHFVVVAGLVLAFISSASAAPAGINQLFVFGDSLSDNGNAAIALGGTLPGNYAPNEFTDGANTTPSTSGPYGLWIEQFAAKAGIADPTPYLANPLGTSNINYAVASATVEGSSLQDIPSQLTVFGGTHLTGAPSDALYAIWGGANDILNGNSNGASVADTLASDTGKLAAGGAKYFLWLNLPPLGDTPLATAAGNTSADNAASAAFDAEWLKDIALLDASGVTVIGVDVDSLFNSITSNPGAYGFTNTSSPAQGTAGPANDYLFWDQEHPTTAADALIASLAYNDLEAAFPSTAVPEPSAALLGLVGCAAAVLARRKRRLRA